MLAEDRLHAEITAMVRSIEVPRVSMPAISGRLAARQDRAQSVFPSRRFALGSAAAAAAVLLVSASFIPGVVRAVEGRYAEALRAIGIQPPPAAPRALVTSLASSRAATIADAQARVTFTIVPPSGLPSDVVIRRIITTPTGRYSAKTATWSKGESHVTFLYGRRDGRTFAAIAEHFDPKDEPAPRYIFEPVDLPGGAVRLIKHENFAWRNGDQSMTIVAGGVSAKEIVAIRSAMRGTPLPQAEATAPSPGRRVKLYVLPKPTGN